MPTTAHDRRPAWFPHARVYRPLILDGNLLGDDRPPEWRDVRLQIRQESPRLVIEAECQPGHVPEHDAHALITRPLRFEGRRECVHLGRTANDVTDLAGTPERDELKRLPDFRPGDRIAGPVGRHVWFGCARSLPRSAKLRIYLRCLSRIYHQRVDDGKIRPGGWARVLAEATDRWTSPS
jgi:hypothetical protein